MDPVWTLFSRRTFSRLRYWLSALGYDLRDRTALNRIYLVYFCAFWSIWAFAVIALLGNVVTGGFNQIQDTISPPLAVVTLAEVTISLWGLVTLWQVSRRSPFIFTEEDAYLICQTPVDRRKVALLWFLQGMIAPTILFAAGTIILSFALVEWSMQAGVTYASAFDYPKVILRALILVLAVQVGVQAALWGIGALRLHQRKVLAWLRPVFFGAVLLCLASLLIPTLCSLLLAPLRLPLEAAFVEDISPLRRLVGLSLSFLYLAAGLAFLSAQSREINLQRAAQETSLVAAINLALSYGQFGLVESIQSRQRFGTTRPPSRLLARRDWDVVFWKDLQQFLRTLRLRELVNLVWIFGLSLGMFVQGNWVLQMVIAGVWTITIGGLATRRLRSDLARWWLLHSLPIYPQALLRYEFLLSWGIYTLISLAGLFLSTSPLVFKLFAALLMPILVANATLAAAQDILRHSRARMLMSPSLGEENVPRQNIWGVLVGLISVLIPFGILVIYSASSGQLVCIAAALPIAVIITLFNMNGAQNAFRRIE